MAWLDHFRVSSHGLGCFAQVCGHSLLLLVGLRFINGASSLCRFIYSSLWSTSFYFLHFCLRFHFVLLSVGLLRRFHSVLAASFRWSALVSAHPIHLASIYFHAFWVFISALVTSFYFAFASVSVGLHFCFMDFTRLLSALIRFSGLPSRLLSGFGISFAFHFAIAWVVLAALWVSYWLFLGRVALISWSWQASLGSGFFVLGFGLWLGIGFISHFGFTLHFGRLDCFFHKTQISWSWQVFGPDQTGSCIGLLSHFGLALHFGRLYFSSGFTLHLTLLGTPLSCGLFFRFVFITLYHLLRFWSHIGSWFGLDTLNFCFYLVFFGNRLFPALTYFLDFDCFSLAFGGLVLGWSRLLGLALLFFRLLFRHISLLPLQQFTWLYRLNRLW